jgi:hypothetical protein
MIVSKVLAIRLTAAFAAAASLLSAPASAAVLTFNFTAVRTLVLGTPPPGSVTAAAEGLETITGAFSYDNSVAASVSDPTFARYATGSIVINEFSTAGTRAPLKTEVLNSAGGDSFSIGPSVGATGVDRIDILLQSTETTPFNSTALPTAFNISQFNVINILRFTTSFTAQADYRFTSISQAPSVAEVPLPAALPLFVAGLAGLGMIRRRKAA